ncbi:MAG: hypothetical protein JW740_01785 [Candidatus Zambryskibacteria bacterium]|nr:hypothetical protein [Candidatus Zambryskibacteria bacterium]
MKKIFIILLIVFALGSLLVFQVYAEDYTVLAPLPGTESGGKTNLQMYVPGLITLLIGLSAVVAVLRIVWGGIIYMTSDAIFGKQRGRGMILNSVFALVLVIAAYLILTTINPNLLKFNLNLEKPEIGTPNVSAPASGGAPASGN